MKAQTQAQYEKQALQGFTNLLVGKTIRSVFYMGAGDMENMGWYKRPVVIQFTDGTYIIPQCDDEGNDGAALLHIGVDGGSKVIYTL